MEQRLSAAFSIASPNATLKRCVQHCQPERNSHHYVILREFSLKDLARTRCKLIVAEGVVSPTQILSA